jgi:hypothetical protein
MSASVFFFGGWKASQTDIDGWLRSAKQQKPNIAFTGFPYPSGAGWDYDSAVHGFKKSGQYKAAVAAIQACSADSIYIVGHSSGCAISNAVDKGLKDTSSVVLVALDGFAPDGDQRKRSSTQVWGAVNGHAKSKNYNDLKRLLGHRLKEYQATPDCTTKLALHFSLVNAAATDKLVTHIATGYTHCQANLVWL